MHTSGIKTQRTSQYCKFGPCDIWNVKFYFRIGAIVVGVRAKCSVRLPSLPLRSKIYIKPFLLFEMPLRERVSYFWGFTHDYNGLLYRVTERPGILQVF